MSTHPTQTTQDVCVWEPWQIHMHMHTTHMTHHAFIQESWRIRMSTHTTQTTHIACVRKPWRIYVYIHTTYTTHDTLVYQPSFTCFWYCNTLQHTATHCNTRWYLREPSFTCFWYCSTLQHTAPHCNKLQHPIISKRAIIHLFLILHLRTRCDASMSVWLMHVCHDAFHVSHHSFCEAMTHYVCAMTHVSYASFCTRLLRTRIVCVHNESYYTYIPCVIWLMMCVPWPMYVCTMTHVCVYHEKCSMARDVNEPHIQRW